ncbi:MAG TPA: PD-(D/E)XK nuclease family protein [Tepidisphaeraceae bacterium]|nr:PD-(D/E)XK nuclease family protein [Tepidisphaeraceae bacterium]
MSVRFVLGRAGSGKTKRCFDAVVDALKRDPMGPMLYWIVPKQATFMIERELTCASGLPGFMRARVVSFEQLGEDVLADCGGSAVPEVTATGRQMVLGHLLRIHQPSLKFFGTVARQSGLAIELDQTFAELERCGKDSADLQRVIEELTVDDSGDASSKALLDKFHDLHLLYDAYTKYLGQERLDPHRRLAQVLHSVEHCRPLQQADFYVDGFLDFTEYERQLLAGLAKVCRQMEITLLVDPDSAVVKDPHQLPDDLNRFHRTESTFRKLWFTFTEQDIDPAIERLTTLPRFTNPALAILEKTLLTRKFGRSTVSQGISFVETPDRRSEVDAAARKIRSWLDDGLRLRDIAVLMRDLSSYHELIDASFREHGIPYFVDRRRPATHHPLLQLTRNLFMLAHANWPNDAMMTILKSGLAADITLDDADELENYVLAHRIVGSAWESKEPWRFRRTPRTAREGDELQPAEQIELQRINDIRRAVVDPIRPFVETIRGGKLSIRQIVSALFAAFQRLDVPNTLAEWIKEAGEAGRLEERGEHEQVWTELVKLFDQMVDLMGDEVVALGDSLTILDSGLEQFDLALTPPTVDQVLVGAVDRTRTSQIKATLLLGMNEGEFPKPPRDAAMISDGERESLRRRKLEIDPDTERRLLDEQLLGYIALTRSSSHLCLTRALADDAARPLAPSLFWTHARRVFPDAHLTHIDRNATDRIDCIGTPRQLVTSLMRWVHNQAGAAIKADDACTGLYDWLARRTPHDDPIDTMRYRSWRALNYRNDAGLSPQIAAKIFASPLHASVSRIETFAVCPFKHFAQYGLKLRDRDDEEVTALDLGNVYHGILENIVRAMVQEKQGWDGSEANEAAVRRYAKQIGAELRDEILLSTARNEYLLQRVEKTLDQVIASQGAAAGRGRFKPAYAELGFGIEGGQLPPYILKTPGGKQVVLHGKIDRVDLLEEQAAFVVIDYKLRGNTLALDRVYYGISLQLLTYLLVLEAHGEQLAGKKLTPVAAFYVRLLRDLEDVDHPADATPPEDEAFDLKTKPRGCFDARYFKSLDQAAHAGEASQVVAAYLKKDGGFGHKGSTDVADPAEFTGLLNRVHSRIGELSDALLSGDVSITPFRIKQQSPCVHCAFRSVCRFELPTNRYNILTPMSREQVLEKVVEEAENG